MTAAPIVEPGRILVTGGVRSGKSRYAEQLLAEAEAVSYVAPGAVPDPEVDSEWAARIAEHQLRRPAHWTTIETTDLARALRTAETPILIDCLGAWVTAVVDEFDTWDQPLARWQARFDERLDEVAEAWTTVGGTAIAVTNEVGWSLVSEHRSGRIFTDLLGRVNQRIAAASDGVILVVAGRALRL